MSSSEPPGLAAALAWRHLRIGWWALLLFLTIGIVLEGLHGFKIGWYLNVSNETRRLMLTLAHAHGVLLALVNVVFALTLRIFDRPQGRALTMSSRCLAGAPFSFLAGSCLAGLLFTKATRGWASSSSRSVRSRYLRLCLRSPRTYGPKIQTPTIDK